MVARAVSATMPGQGWPIRFAVLRPTLAPALTTDERRLTADVPAARSRSANFVQQPIDGGVQLVFGLVGAASDRGLEGGHAVLADIGNLAHLAGQLGRGRNVDLVGLARAAGGPRVTGAQMWGVLMG